MISLFDTVSFTAPKLAIYAFLLFLHFYFGAFSPIIAVSRIILSFTCTIVGYILNAVYHVVSALLAICWAIIVIFWTIIVFSFIHHITGHPASKYIPFLRVEETVKAQIAAIEKQKRRTIRQIEQLVPQIEQWNKANNLLMKDIRSAEVIVKKRVPKYNPYPDRVRFHDSGVQFRVVPTFAEAQAESTLPSRWAFVRWLKKQDEKPVFEARREANRLGRIRTMRERAVAYLQREHEELQTRLAEARERKEEAWRMPEPVVRPARASRRGCTASEYQARLWSRQEAPVYQQPIVSEYTRRLEEVQKYNGQVKHWCNDCDERHTWLHQYNTVAAALSVPQFYPCPAAVARHERMRITFGLAAPPPPPPLTLPTPITPSQPIYAAAPGPEPAAGHSFFSAPIQTVTPTVTQAPPPPPPQALPTMPVSATPTIPPARVAFPLPPPPPPTPAPAPEPKPAPATVRLPPRIIPRQPGNVPPPRLIILPPNPPAPTPTPEQQQQQQQQQPSSQGRSLFERMTFGADGQPLRAAPTAGEANKENEAPRERRFGEEEAERRAKRSTRGEESWEERREALAARTRYRC